MFDRKKLTVSRSLKNHYKCLDSPRNIEIDWSIYFQIKHYTDIQKWI